MDTKQDLEELISLHKECESDPEAANHGDELKKAKVGIINLKAYMSQVCSIYPGGSFSLLAH